MQANRLDMSSRGLHCPQMFVKSHLGTRQFHLHTHCPRDHEKESLHRHPATCATGIVEGYDSIQSSDKDYWEQENVENHNILKTNAKKKSLLRNRGLVSAMLLSCIWNLHDMAYSELFSLWAESPGRYGGLDMTTANVGVILAISGGMLLVFQSFIYSWLQNMLGPIKASRISSVLSVPLVVIYPLMARLNGTLLWGVVIFASILKTILSASVNTASYILINNSVTSDRRGLANGISMSLISLFRAIAPTCAGYMYALKSSLEKSAMTFLGGVTS